MPQLVLAHRVAHRVDPCVLGGGLPVEGSTTVARRLQQLGPAVRRVVAVAGRSPFHQEVGRSLHALPGDPQSTRPNDSLVSMGCEPSGATR
jgi:hypothetical protein